VYHAICEAEALPPSARAADRRVAGELRGDLDTLVLHAMAKEPASRYSSAEAFSAEIDRYLDGRPLTVRRASVFERTRKFVRRNRLAVSATAALAASLIGGVTVVTIEARSAERRFAQVRELANTFLLQFYDQVTPLPGSTAVRASIVETARKYLDALSKEAGRDRDLILELAQAYQRLGDVQGRTGTANLGQLDAARRSYQNALELYGRLQVDKNSPADLRLRGAKALWALARLEYNAEHEAAAEIPTRRMLDLLGDAKADPEVRRWRATANRSLGDIRQKEGNSREAVEFLEAARNELTVLQSSGYTNPTFARDFHEIRMRLARARVFTGDLDGAVNEFLDYLKNAPPCHEEDAPGPACRYLAVWLTWTADVYGAVDRPNLGEPDKAAVLYERAVRIAERLAAADANDRQARFDLAARYGKLGDVVWKSDPRRALQLYEKALATARGLVSKEQFDMLQGSYQTAISRPLIQLGRLAEARRVTVKNLEAARREAPNSYADLLGELEVRLIWARLLLAERKRAEAQGVLEQLIHDAEGIRASHPQDLSPTFYLSAFHRLVASITTGEERRNALLASAATWRAWPATSYTKREEQKDLTAANQ
jgi:tetratricopeptide (TPR) repeat protein